MAQRKSFDLYLARTAGMLSGARRVAMLLVTLLLTMTAQTAWAQELTFEGIVYALHDEDHTAEVTGYDESEISSIFIQTSIESDETIYYVTRIRDEAFTDCFSLEGITIPASVTSIGDGAFMNCGQLSSVTFEDGSQLQSIGNNAFGGCTSLESITIPASVTSIGPGAFCDCGQLTMVVFESGSQLESIGDNAFGDCGGLVIIDIPASVMSIGNNAFGGCTNLNSVNFGDNSQLTTIGDEAFRECPNLASIDIPASVTTIGDNAFSGCVGLQEINVADENSKYCSEDGVLFYKDMTILIKYPASKPGVDYDDVTYYFIPSSVETVAEGAFDDGIDLIIFYHNENISGIPNEDNYKFIAAIQYNPDEVTVEGMNSGNSTSPVQIDDMDYYPVGTEITLTPPDDDHVISSITITNISNGDDVTESLLEGLTFTMPEYDVNVQVGLTQIAGNFGNSDALTWTMSDVNDDDIYETLTISGTGEMDDSTPWEDAFKSTITTVIIGSDVTSIGDNAFGGCTNLESVNFGDYSQLTTIGNNAFSGCEGLESITIPDGVTSIGDNAFSGCTSLESINFGDNSQLTTIGNNAFSGCGGLESITIPDGVTSIGDNAFGGCGGLQEINVAGENSEYCSEDGVLFNKDMTILIKYPAAKPGVDYDGGTYYFIPYEVTSVAEGAFDEGLDLTIFYNNESLNESLSGEQYIFIPTIDYDPDEVTVEGMSIQIDGIDYYPVGTEITLTPTHVISSITIKKQSDESNVTSDLLDGLTFTMPEYNVNVDVELADVTGNFGNNGDLTWTMSDVNEDGTYETLTISGTGEMDGGNRPWEDAFKSTITTVVISDGVTNIHDGTFENYPSLETVTIGNGVTSIGDNAFSGCTNLESVNFGDNSQLTTIGGSAFNNCAISEIAIPAGVTSIGASAFNGCTSLASITFPDGVTSVGSGAFGGTPWFENEENQENGIVYVGKVAYEWKGSATSAVIKDGTVAIAPLAFSCASITSVTIPDGVTTIGEQAFNASHLTSITIPASVTSIGDYAFISCRYLASVYVLPTTPPTFDFDPFHNCEALSAIVVPADYIDAYDWSEHSVVAGYTVTCDDVDVTATTTSSIVSEGEEVSLTTTNTEIPDGYALVYSVNGEPIQGTGFVMPAEDVTVTSDIKCSHNSLTEYPAVEASCKTAGKTAYWECNNCHQYFSDEGSTEIEEDGWVIPALGHELVKHARVEPTEEAEGNIEYWQCTRTQCGKYFSDNSGSDDKEISQTDLVIAKLPVTSGPCGNGGMGGDNLTWEASDGDSNGSHESISVSGTGAMVHFASADEQPWKEVRGEITSVTFGTGVTSIGDNAFSDCTNLASITIPNSVTSIGDHAFEGCISLTSVTIPASVTSIGNDAFKGCNGVAQILNYSDPTSTGGPGLMATTSVRERNATYLLVRH